MFLNCDTYVISSQHFGIKILLKIETPRESALIFRTFKLSFWTLYQLWQSPLFSDDLVTNISMTAVYSIVQQNSLSRQKRLYLIHLFFNGFSQNNALFLQYTFLIMFLFFVNNRLDRKRRNCHIDYPVSYKPTMDRLIEELHFLKRNICFCL